MVSGEADNLGHELTVALVATHSTHGAPTLATGVVGG